MRIHDLGVEEPDSGIPGAVNHGPQRDLARIRRSVEHRLGGEVRAEVDSVDAADQLALPPALRAVSPSFAKGQRVCAHEVLAQPIVGRSKAAPNDPFEIGVEPDFELA